MKTSELNIDEIMNQAEHTGLLEVLCLLKQLRNKVSCIIQEPEIRNCLERWSKADNVWCSLNDCGIIINELVGDIMDERIDEIIKGK